MNRIMNRIMKNKIFRKLGCGCAMVTMMTINVGIHASSLINGGAAAESNLIQLEQGMELPANTAVTVYVQRNGYLEYNSPHHAWEEYPDQNFPLGRLSLGIKNRDGKWLVIPVGRSCRYIVEETDEEAKVATYVVRH